MISPPTVHGPSRPASSQLGRRLHLPHSGRGPRAAALLARPEPCPPASHCARTASPGRRPVLWAVPSDRLLPCWPGDGRARCREEWWPGGSTSEQSISSVSRLYLRAAASVGGRGGSGRALREQG